MQTGPRSGAENLLTDVKKFRQNMHSPKTATHSASFRHTGVEGGGGEGLGEGIGEGMGEGIGEGVGEGAGEVEEGGTGEVEGGGDATGGGGGESILFIAHQQIFPVEFATL